MKFYEKGNNNLPNILEEGGLLNKNLCVSQKKDSLKKKKTKTIFIIIIILFEMLSLIYNPNKINFEKKELKKEILKAEQYYKICQNEIILKKNRNKKFKENENPKISIISTIYNKERYILRFLRSIQNQSYENIEIILIDDFSEDNSIKRIENIKKEDERIILLKNKKNKGTLISRNLGIFLSKGKYVIIPDSDDILLKDLVIQCLNLAEENSYNIIRFQTLLDNFEIFKKNKINYLLTKTIYQPKLSSFMFYGSNHLEIVDPIINNKFILRNTLIYALNYINKYYLNQNMVFYEDALLNFILCKISKSLHFTKKIGYFYFTTPNSITRIHSKNDININKILKSFFLFLRFIIENTKNTKYEKNMVNHILKKERNSIFSCNLLKKINNDFAFFKEIINLYIKNKFINFLLKRRLLFFKKIINKYEKKII